MRLPANPGARARARAATGEAAPSAGSQKRIIDRSLDGPWSAVAPAAIRRALEEGNPLLYQLPGDASVDLGFASPTIRDFIGVLARLAKKGELTVETTTQFERYRGDRKWFGAERAVVRPGGHLAKMQRRLEDLLARAVSIGAAGRKALDAARAADRVQQATSATPPQLAGLREAMRSARAAALPALHDYEVQLAGWEAEAQQLRRVRVPADARKFIEGALAAGAPGGRAPPQEVAHARQVIAVDEALADRPEVLAIEGVDHFTNVHIDTHALLKNGGSLRKAAAGLEKLLRNRGVTIQSFDSADAATQWRRIGTFNVVPHHRNSQLASEIIATILTPAIREPESVEWSYSTSDGTLWFRVGPEDVARAEVTIPAIKAFLKPYELDTPDDRGISKVKIVSRDLEEESPIFGQ